KCAPGIFRLIKAPVDSNSDRIIGDRWNCGGGFYRWLVCGRSPQNGPGTMDRRRPRVRLVVGLAADGRRSLYHLYFSWCEWMGVFTRRSGPLHPRIHAARVRAVFLHSSANLGGRTEISTSDASRFFPAPLR